MTIRGYQTLTSYEQAKHDDLMRAFREKSRDDRKTWAQGNRAAADHLASINERTRAKITQIDSGHTDVLPGSENERQTEPNQHVQVNSP